MTDAAPCEGCACGLADDDAGAERVVMQTNTKFETLVREYLERHGELDSGSAVKQVVVCPRATVAVVERG